MDQISAYNSSDEEAELPVSEPCCAAALPGKLLLPLPASQVSSTSNPVPCPSTFNPVPCPSTSIPGPCPSTSIPVPCPSTSNPVPSTYTTVSSTSWTLLPFSTSKPVSSTPCWSHSSSKATPFTSWPPSTSKPVPSTLWSPSISTSTSWTPPPFSASNPVPSTCTPTPSTPSAERVSKPLSTGYISTRKRKAQASSEIDSRASPTTNFLSSYLPFNSTSGKQAKYGINIPKCSKGLLIAHTKPVLSMEWHPCDPRLLLSASLDGGVRLWDVTKDRKCVTTYNFHGAAVRYVAWATDTTALSAGYDHSAIYMDIGYAKEIVRLKHSAYVSVVKSHLLDRNLVLTGDHDGQLQLWDLRSSKRTKLYKGACGKILDAVFLPKCDAFVASADIVRRNSFSQAMNVWDVDSGITLTHQLYFEPFTCPCLKVHRQREEILAQSNGNYIVLFSGTKPFKINKCKRFQGHFVSGFDVGLDLDPDESVLCSGSSEGKVHFYDYASTKLIRTLTLTDSATLAVTWNRNFPFRVAVSDWNGKIHILQ